MLNKRTWPYRNGSYTLTFTVAADIIIAQLRDIEAGMWIGMHMWNGDKDNNWLWVDNSEKTFENWEFSDPGEVRM